MSVIKSLFLAKDKAVQELWQDPQIREQLLKDAAKEMMDCEDFIWNHPKEQLIALAMQSSFSDYEESCYVAEIINKYLPETKDIFPLVTKHKGLELAERGLVSLSFFYDFMKKRERRYGAPSPEFYGKMARLEFERNFKPKISKHFEDWKEFWNDQFKLSNINNELIQKGVGYTRIMYQKKYGFEEDKKKEKKYMPSKEDIFNKELDCEN